MKKNLILSLGTVALLAAFASTSSAQVIVAENFGGLAADPLNGTTADTFAAGITTAGGSSTWAGQTVAPRFNADGSISTSSNSDGAAYLSVGEYINNAKGDADGIFDLQATFTDPTTGNWVSLGFFSTTNSAVGSNFVNGTGIATAVYRNTENEVDYFAGPQATNTPTSGTAATGTQTIRIRLDLSGYDGITDFGTVSYFLGSSTTEEWFYDYTVDRDFEAIGFTQDNGANSVVSAFSLTQVPEPTAFAMLLGGLGLLTMFRRRRA